MLHFFFFLLFLLFSLLQYTCQMMCLSRGGGGGGGFGQLPGERAVLRLCQQHPVQILSRCCTRGSDKLFFRSTVHEQHNKQSEACADSDLTVMTHSSQCLDGPEESFHRLAMVFPPSHTLYSSLSVNDKIDVTI